MKAEYINYARDLIKSINVGLNRLEKGSVVEDAYLKEKTQKLFDIVREE